MSRGDRSSDRPVGAVFRIARAAEGPSTKTPLAAESDRPGDEGPGPPFAPLPAMSEGPEVRRTADRLAEALLGRRVEAFESRRVRALPACAARIVGSRVMSVRAHGKHLLFRFSRRVYLRNHMLMWGKWCTYTRDAYESGRARPPPRVSWRKRPGAPPQPAAVDDVRLDARVRLVLLTDETAAVQFNGPILEFTAQDPA